MTRRRPHSLVPAAVMQRWKREYKRLGKQTEAIERRRADLKTMIDTGASLAPIERDGAMRVQRRPRKRPTKSMVARKAKTEVGEGTWTSTIEKIVLDAKRISYGALKGEILRTPLSTRLLSSEKGFYGAIGKLAEKKKVMRHKGHLFSPEAYRKFLAALDAGLVQDVKPANKAHFSPMQEAIKSMMDQRPHGLESKNIIWELRKNPDFVTAIDRNKTYAYNVLRRLVDLNELTRRGKRYYRVTKTEAPPESVSGGASNGTGEDGASPIESQGIGLG